MNITSNEKLDNEGIVPDDLLQEPDDEVVPLADSRIFVTRPVEEESRYATGSGTFSCNDVEFVGIKKGVRRDANFSCRWLSCSVQQFALGTTHPQCDKCHCYICYEPPTPSPKYEIHYQATDTWSVHRRLRMDYHHRWNFMKMS